MNVIQIYVDKKSYPQIFLEGCKYAVKKIKIINTVKEKLNLDESDDESDNDKANKFDKD